MSIFMCSSLMLSEKPYPDKAPINIQMMATDGIIDFHGLQFGTKKYSSTYLKMIII